MCFSTNSGFLTVQLNYFLYKIADALRELGTYAKCIYKPLRKLKKCSLVVADTLKAIMNLPSVDAVSVMKQT